jgi:hypothetical protein
LAKTRGRITEAGKNKHSSHTPATKWPELELEAKKWITDHRNSGISLSTKMIICDVRRWAVTHNSNDFAGTGVGVAVL